MAEKRAAFSLRRRFSLGFSKCRWLRTTLSVPSRSIFFFNRRSALSTGSPFLSLISVKLIHFLSRRLGTCGHHDARIRLSRGRELIFSRENVNRQSGAIWVRVTPAFGAGMRSTVKVRPLGTRFKEQILRQFLPTGGVPSHPVDYCAKACFLQYGAA